MNRLTTPFGSYELTRFPEDPRDRLRAWDAADEYLLRHLDSGTGERGPVDLAGAGQITVLGDRWGALTTALAAYHPTQITDSYLSRASTAANLDRAGIGTAKSTVRLLTTQDPPPERIDVLLVRVPKSLALLEDQLYRLAPHVHEGTVVVGAGMVKEIHTSTLNLFEKILGPTRTSLAEKKARLIFCTPGAATATRGDDDPWPVTYKLDQEAGSGAGLTAVNHAGIFCADRLDVGTRFFLQSIPTNTNGARVVDLGCGNGIVGTAVAVADPRAEIVFTDESYQAVASAKATFRANVHRERERADFLVGDGVAMLDPGSIDLILCNPPFHSHQATTDATALRMFAQSRKALRPRGELWVVANRHMGYHTHLRRLFGNSEVVASEPKFVVLRAVKEDRPRPARPM
ncbi:50S rRNA methyltransferase [Streptomyces sp. WM6373]|uniref:methyltransferase n=1 Tax=Streptomyces TaxID=1883 RepID=UPI0006ADD52D|nr:MULTISPECIES: methyltransferase [unclassified Streptomyces]KOU34392.1 50S rRNA methyltransferase [Streptomyces sp. WM6373]KOU61361.1 50S rRNA methyltransferase [Streptomyces sp. IGB124]KOU77338.1 50S rRNA methyltransferase [Streptomyces sp. XY66]KOU85047.1 50S rRNA methyltransferase [Streptomyces sp. XY58]KOV05288.1 50S rRNA methyltransferase [Streptomyces sp. XY37]